VSDKPKVRKGVVVPAGYDEEGTPIGVFHGEDGSEMRAFRPTEEGKPIMGDLCSMRPREDGTFEAEITELSGGGKGSRRRPGNPAAYKAGWDRIWGNQEIPEA